MSNNAHEILRSSYDLTLSKELIAAYEEAKRNFYLGGHRLSAVEGGRFCEAAYRLLESLTKGSFTPIGDSLNTEKVTKDLAALKAADYSKSIRVYIPRALRVVYDIRNSRDAAHLADGIDPNVQDATLVVSVIDWVMAEFIRMSGIETPDNIQALINGLVTRKIPVIQEFGSFPKVLRADLKASEMALILLYHCGARGARSSELTEWVPKQMRNNLRRTLRTLESKALVHQVNQTTIITYAGQKAVEEKGLLDP
ncbi:hypothetical protein FHS35_002062 [Streptomyces umbrinus]|uniref:hypothetical protein n=1 Tax=Streptomyces umbrinus TaxID=67370 RepID=UPI00167D8043|nr:hypothetical protein [Streptomyces umbrinus]MCR3725214.1 hypothetical protein [Streptomyces umbrinus]GHH63298.1 hypothetical protein GCM10018775_80820 [Streptomyces umbrinus]